MNGTQILKIIFLILIVLLAVAVFVCKFMLGKIQNIDVRNKRVRVLMRIRMGCFLAMLVLLLLVVVIT